MTDDPGNSLGALLRRTMADRLVPDAEGFLSMCADDYASATGGEALA